MGVLSNKKWWKAAGVRAIKTMGQVAASLITVGNALLDIDWLSVLSISAVAGVYSLFTSIGGIPEVDFLMDDSEV